MCCDVLRILFIVHARTHHIHNDLCRLAVAEHILSYFYAFQKHVNSFYGCSGMLLALFCFVVSVKKRVLVKRSKQPFASCFAMIGVCVCVAHERIFDVPERKTRIPGFRFYFPGCSLLNKQTDL